MADLSSGFLGKEKISMPRRVQALALLPDAFLLPSFLLHLLTLTDKTFVEVQAHKVSHSF